MLLCSFVKYRMKRAQTCYLNNDMKSVNISLKEESCSVYGECSQSGLCRSLHSV